MYWAVISLLLPLISLLGWLVSHRAGSEEVKPKWKHFDGKQSGMRTWDTGRRMCRMRAKRQKGSPRPRAEEEAKRPTMPDEKAWKQGHWWAKKEEKESMPQPAEGIWSSQGSSLATPIKGFLLPA